MAAVFLEECMFAKKIGKRSLRSDGSTPAEKEGRIRVGDQESIGLDDELVLCGGVNEITKASFSNQ